MDDCGVEVYRLQLANLPGESLAPSPTGWVKYQQVLSDLVRAAQALQQEKAIAGVRYSKPQDDCRRAAWRAFFQFKDRYADLRPPHAGTIHRSQGSTYDMAYLDLTDIGRNTKWYEIAKLLYVGLTRPRHAVLATGTLPERLYTPRLDPLADEDEAPDPLTASSLGRRDDSATSVDAGADASRPYLEMQPDRNLPPEVENRHG